MGSWARERWEWGIRGPALPPASRLGWRPMNRSIGDGRSRQRNRCSGWGVGEDRSYHPKLWPISKAHLILLHDPESKEWGEWGKKEEEGSDSMDGAALPGFPSGDEGETQKVIWAGRGHVEGALRCWALLPQPWTFLPPSPFPCLAGLGDSWLHWGGAKPLAS